MSYRAEIIGGGVAGLATATAMALRGADVRVHEQAARITEVGAGLQISPNGLAVLDGLGAGDALRSQSVQARAVRLIDGVTGRVVLTLDLAGHRPDQEWRFVHRATLIDILHAAAEAAGATIDTGARIDAAEAGLFADKGALVVGADGIRSMLRGLILGTKAPDFTGQIAWRAIIDDEAPPEVQVWMGPGRHIVSYPLPGGRRNIVAVLESATWAEEGWRHPGDPEKLRKAFGSFVQPASQWLETVAHANVWGLFAHPVARSWSEGGKAVLVGDAAHPMLPFLAQGANMALEDAWVLADCLDKDVDAETAFQTYQNLRAPRVKRVVSASAANARNYHLSNPFVRRVGHAVLGFGGRIAPSAAVGRFDWLYAHDVTGKTRLAPNV